MKFKNARFVVGLALVAMVIASAPAYATGVAFQASSLPLQVRGEGLTETIGAVVLQATGGGTITGGSSVTIVYSGSIASASSFSGTAGLNCSVGGSTTCFNTAPAQLTVSASGGQFTVSFPSPTSNSYTFGLGDYIEVSSVRMNVNALGSGTSTITATLSGTSTSAGNPITFTQSQVTVASIVNPSVKGSIPSTATAIQTCSVPAGATNNFSVKAAELYPAALTSTTDEAGFTPSIYSIANGSQVVIAISNVPAGLAVQALTYTATFNGSSLTTLSSGSAGNANIAATALGSPIYPPTAGAEWLGSTAVTSNTTWPGSYLVSISSNAFQVSTGSAMSWVFNVTGDSTSAVESFTVNFGIGLPNSAGTAFGSGTTMTAIGTVVNATATVSLGPASGVVSFATNNEGSGTIVTVGDCVTNLLFPFTTNQVGFDTSIQISNTSFDKLAFPSGGATQQGGTCTLTYYPTDLTTQTASAAGNPGTPSQFTTPTIPSGGAYSFAQSTSTFKGQSGYMFAVCRFLDAHGFSYVLNGTQATATISQGLLALVIPNSSLAGGRLANPSGATGGVTIGVAGSWEGLVH